MALNQKQKAFISAYLDCWNASEAARLAGYSEKTAGSIGSELLKKPEIAAELERHITERQIKPAEVLERLGAQARSNIGDFFRLSQRWTTSPLPTDEIIDERMGQDPNGNPIREYLTQRVVLDVSVLKDPEKGRLVRKFTDSARSGLSIEMYDAQAAQIALGKALGVLRDNVTVNQEGSLEVVTRVVRKASDDVTS